MTDLTFAAISVAVLCVGWRWCAGPEPPTSKRGSIDDSCQWGTCDCVGEKCEKKEEKK